MFMRDINLTYFFLIMFASDFVNKIYWQCKIGRIPSFFILIKFNVMCFGLVLTLQFFSQLVDCKLFKDIPNHNITHI